MIWDQEPVDVCNRGKIDNKPQTYYLPKGWRGFGIYVDKLYEGNQDWLAMDGREGEWIILFLTSSKNNIKNEISQRNFPPARPNNF